MDVIHYGLFSRLQTIAQSVLNKFRASAERIDFNSRKYIPIILEKSPGLICSFASPSGFVELFDFPNEKSQIEIHYCAWKRCDFSKEKCQTIHSFYSFGRH